MKLLEGQVALVTGGSRGIGRRIVEVFAEAGARVAFTYLRQKNEADALTDACAKKGAEVKGFQSDAASFSKAETLIKDVVNQYERIDVLVNNAGITRDNLLMRLGESDWDEVLRVNLKSCFNTTHHASRFFMRQRKGCVINIGSVVGLGGNAGQANYAAAKAGMVGFTKSVALELGSRHVRCNLVAPGLIETDMTANLDETHKAEWQKQIPLRRIGTPQDVAHACLFLASEWGSYITGQLLQVDGGMRL